MSDVYKLTQKSVWTNNVGRHTTWYLLDERKMGYYIDYIEWTVQRDWGFLKLDSECMAFRYNGKKGCVTSWSECALPSAAWNRRRHSRPSASASG